MLVPMGWISLSAGLSAETVPIVALIVGVAMAAAACYFAISISRGGEGAHARAMLVGSLVLLVVSLGVAAVLGILLLYVN